MSSPPPEVSNSVKSPVLEFISQLEERLNMKMISEFLTDLDEFECTLKCYRRLKKALWESNPKMRTLTLFEGIEVKYNIVKASEENFARKLLKPLIKCNKTAAWLHCWLEVDGNNDHVKCKTCAADPMNCLLQNVDESVDGLAAMNSAFLKLKEEWDEMKGELESVLEHCYGQLQKLIVENGTRRRRR